MKSLLRTFAVLSLCAGFLQACGKSDSGPAPEPFAQGQGSVSPGSIKVGDEVRMRVTRFVRGRQEAQSEILTRVLDVRGGDVQVLTREIPYVRRPGLATSDKVTWQRREKIPYFRADLALQPQCDAFEPGSVSEYALVPAGRFQACRYTRRKALEGGPVGTSQIWMSAVPFGTVREEWRSDDGLRSRVIELLSIRAN